MKIKLIGLSTVLMLCFLCACSGNSTRNGSDLPNSPSYQIISAETAYQMMQELNEFVLLDVRTEGEFRESHIPGAILIPVNELERRAETELPDINAVILVYCRTGVRATTAAGILVDKGYTQVFNFGGIVNWPYETVSVN